MVTQNQSTAIGCIAILLWSVDTIITVHLERLNIFQILAISWILSFVQYAIMLSVRKEWHKVRQPLPVWLIGSVGICGAHFTLVSALREAPPAQVTAFCAIWPIIVIALGGWMFHQQQRWLSLLGAIIGFAGLWLVLTQGNGLQGYRWDYSTGYLLALISCLLWSGYIIMTRKFANITSEMMGMYLGVGGIFALGYHVSFEHFIMPTPWEWLLLLIKGCITLSASYFCWDFAIKRGNFALLNVLSYFNPVLTLALLNILGLTKSGSTLWLGAIFITIAAALCSGIFSSRKNQ
jgi:drug/metabolite transporter (DMT)-like permease